MSSTERTEQDWVGHDQGLSFAQRMSCERGTLRQDQMTDLHRQNSVFVLAYDRFELGLKIIFPVREGLGQLPAALPEFLKQLFDAGHLRWPQATSAASFSALATASSMVPTM